MSHVVVDWSVDIMAGEIVIEVSGVDGVFKIDYKSVPPVSSFKRYVEDDFRRQGELTGIFFRSSKGRPNGEEFTVGYIEDRTRAIKFYRGDVIGPRAGVLFISNAGEKAAALFEYIKKIRKLKKDYIKYNYDDAKEKADEHNRGSGVSVRGDGSGASKRLRMW